MDAFSTNFHICNGGTSVVSNKAKYFNIIQEISDKFMHLFIRATQPVCLLFCKSSRFIKGGLPFLCLFEDSARRQLPPCTDQSSLLHSYVPSTPCCQLQKTMTPA
ncbi:unnamed protein product [Leptidea sinapis]|uniref:Uncharacterized protein n=1 Tax=Leptidea sinapis TaxID=189913 RepID=A0A5E4QJV8_9NEOP|nr:unnamed protein product [Leptidea sinapis]